MSEISISRVNNHLIFIVDGETKQVYPVNNTTFTIKFFPEERVLDKEQVKFYMHILGLDSAYQNHAGIDVYVREGGTTSLLLIDGVDCTGDLDTFITQMTLILS